jgi:hypothetical protein
VDLALFATAAALVVLPFAVALLRDYDALTSRFFSISIFNYRRPAGAFVESYALHLSPVFLFLRGDAQVRHAIPGLGQCLLVTAPLCVAGLARAVLRRRRADILLLVGLAVAPLGGAVTMADIPHATRTIMGVPFFAWLAALGAAAIAEKARRSRLAWSAQAMAVLVNGAVALVLYVRDYPALSAEAWGAGKAQAIRVAASELASGRAKRVIVAFGDCSLYDVLFHTEFDPRDLARKREMPWRFLKPGPSLASVHETLGRDEVLLAHEDRLPGRPPAVTFDAAGPGPRRALWRGTKPR